MPNYSNLDLRGKRPYDTHQFILVQSASVVTDGYGDSMPENTALLFTASKAITSSMAVTASHAESSSYAESASYEIIFEESASHANIADFSIAGWSASFASASATSSYSLLGNSASYSGTSSWAINAQTASSMLGGIISGSLEGTASWANWSVLAVSADFASLAASAVTYSMSASWASQSLAQTASSVDPLHQDVIPTDTNTYNIGSPSKQWKHGYFSTSSLYLGEIPINVTNSTVYVSGSPIATLSGSNITATASWAEWAVNGGTQLSTGSTYPITTSWAEWASNGGTDLGTGSTYYITASWAEWASNGGTDLGTGSTYYITASWAVNAINGGTQLETGSTYPITSSWTEISIQSLTADYAVLAEEAVTASEANNSVASDFALLADSSVSSSYATTASWSTTSSCAYSAGFLYQSPISTGSLIPITSSRSISSSFTVTSSFAITSSYAISSSIALSSSYSARTLSSSYASGSTLASTIPRIIYLTRTCPTTVGNYIEVCNVNVSAGAHNFIIGVTVSDANFSFSSIYLVTTGYAVETFVESKWYKLQPIHSTNFYAPSNPQDVDLWAQQSTNFTTLRLVRTTGTTSGTAKIFILHTGASDDIFTEYSTTGAHTAGLAWWPSSLIRQGQNLINASGSLSMSGSIRIAEYGFKLFGTSSQADSSSWASNSPATTLNTSSTYYITSSWTNTSSYAITAASGGTSLSTGSLYDITSSWAQSASISALAVTSSFALTSSVQLDVTLSYETSMSWASSSFTSSFLTTGVSASWSDTASYALNAGSSQVSTDNSSSYSVLFTSSANWVTLSFNIDRHYVTITTASVYNFTSSNAPVSGTVSNTTLFMDYTFATQTCSLSFPSDWVFIGSKPLSLSASKGAMLSLQNYGGVKTVAACGVQY